MSETPLNLAKLEAVRSVVKKVSSEIEEIDECLRAIETLQKLASALRAALVTKNIPSNKVLKHANSQVKTSVTKLGAKIRGRIVPKAKAFPEHSDADGRAARTTIAIEAIDTWIGRLEQCAEKAIEHLPPVNTLN